jgi:4-amino-4-deoxy-L-arabinose transferase-like glycosyltransferase
MREYDSRLISLLAMTVLLLSVFVMGRMAVNSQDVFRDFAVFIAALVFLFALGILIPAFQIKPDE